MNKLKIQKIDVILATDCGSTTTKAILIEKINGKYRQTHRGEAPTSVEEPFADVTVGVLNAVTEVSELSGRKLISGDKKIISSSENKAEGCDIYISTSSAGGGLQMMVAGVIKEMTAASAKRAALGAGAIVMDVIASNDKRLPHEQIQRIRELRPDMILLSGGTDGGTKTHVVQIGELIAPAKPQPRFGSEYKLPIIYAGNKEAIGNIRNLFKDDFELTVVGNLRPTLEKENLNPARDAIHDLFLDHVMAHAPGYNKLIKWADAPIMPTPGAVGNILQTISNEYEINVVGVDIGGATTDVFSVFDKSFNRTVSANLGMSYSISNVCSEAGMDNILRWIHINMDEKQLRNRVKNKMIRPTTIPQSIEGLIFEQAVAREALRLAFKQHKEFATTLSGVQQQRTVGDTFSQEVGGKSIVDSMKLDLIVASGGVLSHAPFKQQTAMMLIDSFQPEGFTLLAKDSIFMMPHLGVLSQVHSEAAMEVFENDCLIYLGTVIAPTGDANYGSDCLNYNIHFKSGEESAKMKFGEIKIFPLSSEESVKVTIEPEKGFDIGSGFGRPVTKTVRGGEVGLIIDCRGRPIAFGESPNSIKDRVTKWVEAAALYPEQKNRPSKKEKQQLSVSEKAQVFSPGLKVKNNTKLVKSRALPINGKVLPKIGDQVLSTDVVAETFMPGDIYPINLSTRLSIPPSDLPECVKVKVGDRISIDQIIAETKGIFGMFKTILKAPQAGTVETISDVTGQIILRGQPHPVSILAFTPGKIVKIMKDQGVTIESNISLIQGIFGIGGEAFGKIKLACKSPEETLDSDKINDGMEGAIIVGGSRITSGAVKKALSIGAVGLVSGGIDDQDLKEILGYDLGVAITGAEKIGITIIITEGFGNIAMANRTFRLLELNENKFSSINGKTQIRAGVMRPVIISEPQEYKSEKTKLSRDTTSAILKKGTKIRVIRDPYFGLIGEVHFLPSGPQTLESGTKARVLDVLTKNGDILTVPRANIERIEG
tara:strand:+ start:5626 stop:8613 length:2988 start_codon:yes stop_codon:yes gene_type:complete